MSRLQTFMALRWGQKIQLIQAWCMLGWYRVAMLAVPLRRLTGSLRHHHVAVPTPSLVAGQHEQARTIGKLVAMAASVTPWQSRCLVQVLVAQRLLAAGGVPGQICLGVRKGSEDGADPSGLAAHAWLKCGNAVVSGKSGYEDYAVISVFSWGGVST